MCGLFGILQHRGSDHPPRSVLEETARRLHHRGPDASGIWTGPAVGLAHTRLSLVDLDARSHQPFWDPTGRHALIYNGELYDFGVLKRRLGQAGVGFRTTSDTEALLLALIHFGVNDTLPLLEGMFAFAWYDTSERELVLARDRFGIKPLYIHDAPDRFLFGSTVGALAPWMSLEANPAIVRDYLRGSNGPVTGASFYRNVESVPPGTLLRIKVGGRLERRPYHRTRDLADPSLARELASLPEPVVVNRIQEHLQKSVTDQLIADAPVGAFCSGGVDSSLIMAMATRSHQNMKVFHADMVGPLSERSAAERLSRALGVEMHTVEVRDHDFLESLPEVALRFELPVWNPTAIPILLVSRLVAEHRVKAVLSGEGSDECYLGYGWLSPDILGRLGQLLGRRPKHNPLSLRPGDLALVERMIGGSAPGPGARPINSWSGDDEPGFAPTAGLANTPELSYILRSLLHRNDTMGMAASIESRFPFLETELVRLAVNLPERYKVRFSPTVLDPAHLFFRDKWIVRRIARRLVPPVLSGRQKRPFLTNAFQRFRIEPSYFISSVVTDWWRLAPRDWTDLWYQASHALHLRMFFLETWAQLCLVGNTTAAVADRIRAHVTIRPLR